MSQVALISRLNELPRIQSLLHELLEMVNQDDVDFHQLAIKLKWIRYSALACYVWRTLHILAVTKPLRPSMMP